MVNVYGMGAVGDAVGALGVKVGRKAGVGFFVGLGTGASVEDLN